MGDLRRASSLSPPEFYLLTAWGVTVYEAFDEMPYLVGSCARAEPFRDVDVRVMIDDFTDTFFDLPSRVQALNVAMSVWGQRATGLPIDFQFQVTDEANIDYGSEVRNAIGIHGKARLPAVKP